MLSGRVDRDKPSKLLAFLRALICFFIAENVHITGVDHVDSIRKSVDNYGWDQDSLFVTIKILEKRLQPIIDGNHRHPVVMSRNEITTVLCCVIVLEKGKKRQKKKTH